jgi:hypothetical protein
MDKPLLKDNKIRTIDATVNIFGSGDVDDYDNNNTIKAIQFVFICRGKSEE